MDEDISVKKYWEGMDYPHKYDFFGELSHNDGLYFLSDIEVYLKNNYGLSDDNFYGFLAKNYWSSGRHWEKVLNIEPTDNDLYKDYIDTIISEFGETIYVDYYKPAKFG